jgi:hypothetical protein
MRKLHFSTVENQSDSRLSEVGGLGYVVDSYKKRSMGYKRGVA